jgi:hypothetical protein
LQLRRQFEGQEPGHFFFVWLAIQHPFQAANRHDGGETPPQKVFFRSSATEDGPHMAARDAAGTPQPVRFGIANHLGFQPGQLLRLPDADTQVLPHVIFAQGVPQVEQPRVLQQAREHGANGSLHWGMGGEQKPQLIVQPGRHGSSFQFCPIRQRNPHMSIVSNGERMSTGFLKFLLVPAVSARHGLKAGTFAPNPATAGQRRRKQHFAILVSYTRSSRCSSQNLKTGCDVKSVLATSVWKVCQASGPRDFTAPRVVVVLEPHPINQVGQPGVQGFGRGTFVESVDQLGSKAGKLPEVAHDLGRQCVSVGQQGVSHRFYRKSWIPHVSHDGLSDGLTRHRSHPHKPQRPHHAAWRSVLAEEVLSSQHGTDIEPFPSEQRDIRNRGQALLPVGGGFFIGHLLPNRPGQLVGLTSGEVLTDCFHVLVPHRLPCPGLRFQVGRPWA